MYYFRIISVLLLTILSNFGCSAELENEKLLKANESSDEPLSPVLPPIKVGEKTYYVETFLKVNWHRAAQFCRYHGMELASINNQEENDKLVGALKSLYDGTLHRFWTSGNDFAANGTYFWLSTGADLQFEYWWPGEPNNPKERCVEYRGFQGTPDIMWNDSTCESESYFICEM